MLEERDMSDGREYLTVKEAAHTARIHPMTLYKLIRRFPSRAPPFARIRRSIRIPADKFHAWLERKK